MPILYLQVVAPTPAPGACVDPYVITLLGQIQVLFDATYSLQIKSPNEPTVEQRDYVWFKTNSLTDVIEGVFSWSAAYGKWLMKHPVEAASSERRLYIGSLLSLETFDGGESATVSDTTGPFWEQDADFNELLLGGVGGAIAAVATNYDLIATGTGAPEVRGVYVIKRTARIYVRGS